MEVASPLALPPSSSNKRSLAYSPLTDAAEMDVAAVDERVSKRRRFHHKDTSIESLSEDFSSQSLFYKNMPGANKGLFPAGSTLKRLRNTESPSNPAREELNRVVQEQASLIASLKSDKTKLEESVTSMKRDHERVVKENTILRKAVTIQQERQTNSENEVKAVKAQADERIKALEQVILSLRYHLSTQQNTIGNDFMHQRPPDVY